MTAFLYIPHCNKKNKTFCHFRYFGGFSFSLSSLLCAPTGTFHMNKYNKITLIHLPMILINKNIFSPLLMLCQLCHSFFNLRTYTCSKLWNRASCFNLIWRTIDIKPTSLILRKKENRGGGVGARASAQTAQTPGINLSTTSPSPYLCEIALTPSSSSCWHSVRSR